MWGPTVTHVTKKSHRRDPVSNEDAAEIMALFLMRRKDLERYLEQRLGSSHEAKELAQQAYERLLQRRRRGATDYWDALLFRTARNLAFNRIKQRNLRAKRAMSLEVEDPRTPESQLEADEQGAAIAAAIEQLPSRRRDVIHLLTGDPPLSFGQIAERLKICERTCRREYKRAVDAIRSKLNLGGGRS